MSPYADTNLLTRVYLRQAETEEALSLIETSRSESARPFPITWLHRIEVVNALQLHVFTARAPGQLFVTPEQAALAQANFREDLERETFLQRVAIQIPELERRFEDLSLRHTARHGFRTYDLLHVASALVLECDPFWSFDPKATKLAALEGLKVRR
jgi:predicted nucleic acid-binding protein